MVPVLERCLIIAPATFADFVRHVLESEHRCRESGRLLVSRLRSEDRANPLKRPWRDASSWEPHALDAKST